MRRARSVAVQQLEHRRSNFRTMCFQGEVTAVQELNFGIGVVSFERAVFLPLMGGIAKIVQMAAPPVISTVLPENSF